MNHKEFKKSFSAVLKANDFKSKSGAWYWDGSEATVVLSLQKCDYSDLYFFDIGFSLGAEAKTQFPRPNHCHLQFRSTALWPEKLELVYEALTCTPDKIFKLAAVGAFLVFLEEEVIPFCKSCGSLSVLRDAYVAGRFRDGLVMKVARDAMAS